MAWKDVRQKVKAKFRGTFKGGTSTEATSRPSGQSASQQLQEKIGQEQSTTTETTIPSQEPQLTEQQAKNLIEFQSNTSVPQTQSIRQDTPQGRVDLYANTSQLNTGSKPIPEKKTEQATSKDNLSGMRNRITKQEERVKNFQSFLADPTVQTIQETKTGRMLPGQYIEGEQLVFFPSEDIRTFANQISQPQKFESIKEINPRIMPGWYEEKPAQPPTPYTDRTLPGKTAELTIFSLAESPVAIGGLIPAAGANVAAIGEALTHKETRQNIPEELGRAGTETIKIFNPTTPEGASTLTIAALTAPLLIPELRTRPPITTAMKTIYKSKYIPIEETGITFVEGVTIPRLLEELKTFQNKEAVTIHVSPGDIFQGENNILLKSQPGAGDIRQKYDLYNFYKSAPSSPNEYTLIKSTPPPETKFPASVWDFAYEEGTPSAYLGYLGITKGINPDTSSGKVLYTKPIGQLYIGRDIISQTPEPITKLPVKQINRYQLQKSGETLIPAENYALIRDEGQFITPAKYENVPGYTNTPGSILEKTGETKFTYYEQVKENPYTNPVARKLWDVFGKKKETYKFEITPVETKPVPEAIKNNIPDLPIYAEDYSGATIINSKPQILSSSMSKITGSIPTFSKSQTISESNLTLSRGSISNPSSIPAGRSLSISIISASKSQIIKPIIPPSSPPSHSRSPTISIPPSSPPISIPPSSPPISIPPSSPPITISPSKITSSKPNKIEIPTPPENPLSPFDIGSSGLDEAFDVFVRKKGKFVKINRFPLIKEEAMGLGSFNVGNTARATFKLIPTAERVGQTFSKAGKMEDFYQSRKRPQPLTWIEKASRRIKSPGEKQEITMQGIIANKKRGWSL